MDEKSCFITGKIKQNESSQPETRHIRFFEDILNASEHGYIDKSGLSDLSSYFSRILTKNWEQLIRISGEIIADPVGRLENMIGQIIDFPEINFSIIFSDIRDRESFEAAQKRIDKYGLIQNLKVSSVQGGHFSHIKPEGIYRNLELI